MANIAYALWTVFHTSLIEQEPCKVASFSFERETQ